MHYFGMFILIWLLVGFIIGLKHLLVDGTYEEMKEEFKKDINKNKLDKNTKEMHDIVFKNKINYLVFQTMLGLVALYVELQVLWIDIKYFFKRMKYRFKYWKIKKKK